MLNNVFTADNIVRQRAQTYLLIMMFVFINISVIVILVQNSTLRLVKKACNDTGKIPYLYTNQMDAGFVIVNVQSSIAQSFVLDFLIRWFTTRMDA